jgi:hypothetical protein
MVGVMDKLRRHGTGDSFEPYPVLATQTRSVAMRRPEVAVCGEIPLYSTSALV